MTDESPEIQKLRADIAKLKEALNYSQARVCALEAERDTWRALSGR